MVPDIQQQDIDAVVKVLETGMLVQGKEVAILEENICHLLGCKHAIAVSNGTASLHLALIAAGIGCGDEVIVPALSYIATANVVELVGAKPVFVDININTFNIDSLKIESAITKRTKAIIPVHEFGLAADMNDIKPIAEKYNLFILEDAACALGARDGEKYCGTFGHAASFSFHPRKAITSGEGGMIVTNDDTLAQKVRALRNHGVETINSKVNFIVAGFNYRLTDFQAALVNSQLLRLHTIINYKRELASIYLADLKNIKQVHCPSEPTDKFHTWQSFHIVVDSNRDGIIDQLRLDGIGSNYGGQCIPAQKFYLDKYELDCHQLFPNALRAYEQGLVLPLYERLNESDVEFVLEKLKAAIIQNV